MKGENDAILVTALSLGFFVFLAPGGGKGEGEQSVRRASNKK